MHTAAALEAANRSKSLPTLASKRNSVSGNEQALLARRKLCHRQQAIVSPLSTHAAGAQKKKSHAHHYTRSSARNSKRGPVVKAEDQCSDTAALTMLADAALMDL